MFGLSQSSGYAIQALSCLGSDRCAHESVASIAECTGIPKPYLAKIIGRLAAAELIISRRGNGGGIWLAKPAEDITLLEIAEKSG